MMQQVNRSRWLIAGIVGAVAIGAAALVLLTPSLRAMVVGKERPATDKVSIEDSGDSVEFFRDSHGNPGLRLSDESVAALQIRPQRAQLAVNERPLPPQVGQINYDNDRLWTIRSRFPGEVAEIAMRPDTETASSAKECIRPLRAFDKVKPDETLAVVWSQSIGTAKASLVDATLNLNLSKRDLDRKEEGYFKGVTSLAQKDQAERQVQLDKNALLTAERSLRFWKLSDAEIIGIKAEAQTLIDRKEPRTIEEEMRWARVEIKAPKVKTEANGHTLLTVVEKNTSLNDVVDPINSPPLFKLADLSRLQIWVHPPEDITRLVQERLRNRRPGDAPLRWHIRFQADATEAVLDIVQVAPSVEPNQRTPMVIGYLPNPDGRRLVGQFVTATIFAPPDENTVEIRTDAVLESRGQSFVFVETGKNEYTQRRVAVVRRFKDATFVRSKLTREDEELSEAEVKQGRQKIEPLGAGDRVVSRGVVELMACLEDQLTKERVASPRKE
jgi:multidrug efflux pump subunit AcrA (membrane-fusion protein)